LITEELVGSVGLIFKYSDMENYYAVELNPSESRKIRLLHIKDGTSTELGDFEEV